MPDGERKNYKLAVAYLADEAVVPYSVAPLPASVGRQPFAELPQVLAALKVLVNPRINHLPGVLIHSFQLFERTFRVHNMVFFHRSRSSLTSSCV